MTCFYLLSLRISQTHSRIFGRRSKDTNKPSLSFWGEVNSQSPPSNFVFDYTCKLEIIKVFQNEFPVRFEGLNSKLKKFTDGCEEQFKSRHSAYEMTHLCGDCNIGEVLHAFAPTAQFKCCNDTKSWLRKQELSGNIRVTDAWSAFKELHANMGQPEKRNRHTSFRFQLSARHHYFVVYANMQTDVMKAHDRVIT